MSHVEQRPWHTVLCARGAPWLRRPRFVSRDGSESARWRCTQWIPCTPPRASAVCSAITMSLVRVGPETCQFHTRTNKPSWLAFTELLNTATSNARLRPRVATALPARTCRGLRYTPCLTTKNQLQKDQVEGSWFYALGGNAYDSHWWRRNVAPSLETSVLLPSRSPNTQPACRVLSQDGLVHASVTLKPCADTCRECTIAGNRTSALVYCDCFDLASPDAPGL